MESEKKVSPRVGFFIRFLKKKMLPLEGVFGFRFLKEKRPPLECVFGFRFKKSLPYVVFVFEFRFMKNKNASPRGCFWIQIIKGTKGLPLSVFLNSDF